MTTLGRIVVGIVAAAIAALFLIAGLLSQFALETGLAFVGALVGVLLSGVLIVPRTLMQVIRAAIIGVYGTFILYGQVGDIPRSLAWLFGFGLSSGMIYGLTLAFVCRAVRHASASTEESKQVADGK